jgi:hypothetical protein
MEIGQQIKSTNEINQVARPLDLNILSTSLNIVDVRILKQFYYPEPTAFVFKYLYQRFKKYGWKEKMIRYRLRRLAKMGLVEIVPKTKPLCILPVNKHERQLKILIMALLGKYDLIK